MEHKPCQLCKEYKDIKTRSSQEKTPQDWVVCRRCICGREFYEVYLKVKDF